MPKEKIPLSLMQVKQKLKGCFETFSLCDLRIGLEIARSAVLEQTI